MTDLDYCAVSVVSVGSVGSAGSANINRTSDRAIVQCDPLAENLRMNQQCKVCGEPAAGFHFGAFTCEGCKSFFGRSYNNLSSISECKNNGCCVINKKNRTSCKACRLRKCLMVGMSKSGSRYGRRSNWFKIHCLLQEQQQSQQQHSQQQQQQQPKSGIFFPPSSIYSQEAFFNNHRLGVRKHEDTSSEDSATSSPHPQNSPAFFPNPALFLPGGRFPPENTLMLHSRKRKHNGGDSSSEDSMHSSSQNNLSSPHPQTPPMFFPNPALFLPSRFAPDPLQHSKRFEDNSSESSANSSRNNNNNNNNNKLPLGFYPNPFLPSRVIPDTLQNSKKSRETSSESSAGEDSDFSRPQSAATRVDSPASPADDVAAAAAAAVAASVYHRRKLSATVMLTSSPNMYTPQRLPLPPGAATQPGLTPAASFLGEACGGAPGRAGGDLLMCSPALAGVAVEQDQPIDLSVKATTRKIETKSVPIELEETDTAPRNCKDGVLDLTNKRTANVMI